MPDTELDLGEFIEYIQSIRNKCDIIVYLHQKKDVVEEWYYTLAEDIGTDAQEIMMKFCAKKD